MDCDVIKGSRQACGEIHLRLEKKKIITISLIFGEHIIRLPYVIIFVSFLHGLFVRSSDYPRRG